MSNTQDPIKLALQDLLFQVEQFCARHGEADFETARAHAALQSPAPQPQGDAREAFEAWHEQEYGNKPMRWSQTTEANNLPEAYLNHYIINDVEKAWKAWHAATAQASEPSAYTYASKQSTKCAGCSEHKHTPLRIDAMGGYVCLTCIDKKLGGLLNEFGYASGPVSEGWQLSVADGHAGYGVYAHMEEYPEEGATLVLELAAPARAVEPLTDEQRAAIMKRWHGRNWTVGDIIDAVEAHYLGTTTTPAAQAKQPTTDAPLLREFLAEAERAGVTHLNEYGSTELPHEIFGANMTDGDKRLARLIMVALGIKHPAFDDLVALLMSKSQSPAQPRICPVAHVMEQLEDNEARVRWIFNPVPVGEELLWDHGE